MSDPILLAVLGDPIGHSKSPLIHQAFANTCGLSIDYQAIHCPKADLEKTLKELYAAGALGLNLTVPLKEAAISFCESLSPQAQRAGSVNTLIRGDRGWTGDNTDGAGLVDDFRAKGINLDQARLLVIGAGGAVAGVCGALLDAGVARIAVMNRTYERAKVLCDRFNDARLMAMSNPPLDSPLDSGLPFDVLIQATSVGHSQQRPHLNPDWLRAEGTVYDLNYGPAHVPIAQWAETHGFRVTDGLGMLVRQAQLAFHRWTGKLPEIEPVYERLRKGLTST